MTSRRFSWITAEPAPATTAGFVPCPVALAACSPHHDRLGEIYRIAFEKARELHRPSRWAKLYAECSN